MHAAHNLNEVNVAQETDPGVVESEAGSGGGDGKTDV